MFESGVFLHEETISPDWTDESGRLKNAFFARCSDRQADAFFNLIGIGDQYVRETRHSLFVLESHTNYFEAARVGERVRLCTRLISFDRKRLHVLQLMFRVQQTNPSATMEILFLHVDLGARRSTPMPPEALRELERLHAIHGHLPFPPDVGRSIHLTHPK